MRSASKEKIQSENIERKKNATILTEKKQQQQQQKSFIMYFSI